jgi:outer membrane protein insertion porin family
MPCLGRFRRGLFASLLLCLTVLLLGAPLVAQQQALVEDIRIHGNRRIPAETIRARMFTRPGDIYDPAAVERDFNSLWNSGYFEDLRIEREASPKGWILQVYVKEKPTIREIKYIGLTAVSQSDVLDKFKELKVGLTQESPFDPTRVKRAEVVLKELLAAHGHQFATVTTEIHQIPPAAVGITFNIHEGPKVKVGVIRFEGNKKVSAKYLRSAMTNLKPIGIPHSIILENLISRTYDATKLSEDAERVRLAYQDKGYFKAIVEDPKTKIRDVTGIAWYFPFVPRHGKAVDITVPVEEGDRYKLKAITFSGNKALSNTESLRRLFKTKDGEWFSRADVSKGLDELRKAYSTLGYINETNIPNTVVNEADKTITLKIDVDEGKQFFVRRIEFTGNTTTRDKVIRRELALEEGQVYNSRLWDLSLLRLNQLNYFEALKPDQDSEVHQNVADNTVDIDLKVKEKGKNSIGLNGGLSGLAGAFVGLNYQTNNFLGLGETLSMSASFGNYEKDYEFGFTEPYLLDKPIQAGFTAYYRQFRYDQLAQASVSPLAASLGGVGQVPINTAAFFASLQNYAQNSKGFTLSTTYAVPRSFHRFSITYGWDNSDITTFTPASQVFFQDLAFRSDVSGAGALHGIHTSKLTPSFSSSTLDNPMRPHRGHSYFIGMDIAGIGGNVADIRPTAEYKQFFPMKGLHMNARGNQTLGIRVQGSFVTGYGGKTASPVQRFFQGGDTDLRGFDVLAVSPTGVIDSTATVPLTNPDGSTVVFDPNNPRNPCGAAAGKACPYDITVPVRYLVYPGGDFSWVANVEYRIPIAGPVTLAPFIDTGMDMAVRQSQLRLADQQVNALDQTQFGCPSPNSNYTACQDTQNLMFGHNVSIVPNTNYVVRMSTGLELQLVLPMINAPFRIYYAYNPLRVDTMLPPANLITPSMFPGVLPDGRNLTGATNYTLRNAIAQYDTAYRLLEPRKTFRLSVATTF